MMCAAFVSHQYKLGRVFPQKRTICSGSGSNFTHALDVDGVLQHTTSRR